MSTVDQVRAAKSSQEAMIALAQALDTIGLKLVELVHSPPMASGFDAWDSPRWETGNQQEEAFRVEQAAAEGGAIIDLPAPSPARFVERLTFGEQSLRLDEYYKNAEGTVTAPEGYDSWNHVYAKGGPYWLYTQDRDLVMGLPYSTRQALVADLEQDDPKIAAEVGRDILKQDAESSRAGAPA